MKSVVELFENALNKKRTRGFLYIYVAVDMHGTIVVPTKRTKIVHGSERVVAGKDDLEFYDGAVSCLRKLSDSDEFKLILWTSAKDDAISDFLDGMMGHGVVFDYINENPEFPGNSYTDFSRKFCFDILLDDKAGFDPEEDWKDLEKLLKDEWF